MNSIIRPRNTDQTQGDLHRLDTGLLGRKKGREHDGLIHKGEVNSLTEVGHIRERK